jgi:hypothetical protein|tara:strand:+ start:449 stop:691 length:243 start_codon:yes stop_codon:yes gene_type:complete
MTKKLTHHTQVSFRLQQSTREFPTQIMEVQITDSCSTAGVSPLDFNQFLIALLICSLSGTPSRSFSFRSPSINSWSLAKF